MNKLSIFAYNKNDNPNPSISYKGYYDGNDFVPKLGYCKGLDELYEYDYVQIFGDDGLKSHIPKRFHGDLLVRMQKAYGDVFGLEQMSLFEG